MNLTSKKCQPCEGIGSAYTKEEAEAQLPQVLQWKITDDGKAIFRDYKVKNFMVAVKFINDIAEIAEAEDHHPDIHLTGYRNVHIDLTTHALGGLTENDFIVAAKINEIKIP